MKSIFCPKCNSHQKCDVIWIKFYKKINLVQTKAICDNCKSTVIDKDKS